MGLSEVLRLGTQVTAGDPLALVHAADADTAERIAARLTQAFTQPSWSAVNITDGLQSTEIFSGQQFI